MKTFTLRSAPGKLQSALFVAMAVLASAQPVYAEDIEIYLQAGTESAGSNVLLQLETAGQVNTNFGKDSITGGSTSDEMFYAMNKLVDTLSGSARVGIGAQNTGKDGDGGHIGFAITSLEESAPAEVSAFVNRSAADAVQERAASADPWGAVNIADEKLALPHDRPNGMVHEATRRLGFAFNGLGVPSWAAIKNATLTLKMTEIRTGAETAYMAFENTNSASATLFDTTDIDTRVWSKLYQAGISMSGDTMTIDVSELVAAMVQRDGWCGRNELVLMIDRTSFSTDSVPAIFSYRARDADGVLLGGAELEVEWDPTKASTPRPEEKSCMGGVELTLAENDNDASESLDGAVEPGVSSLLLGHNSGANRLAALKNNTNYLGGLRFPAVPYGPETEVGSAALVLQVAEAGSGALLVKPMLGNTGRFAAKNAITAAGNGDSTLWASQTVTVGQQQLDVTDMVQAVFKSAGWAAGSALGFRLENTTLSNAAQRILIQAREGGVSPAVLRMSVLSARPGDHAASISKRDALRATLARMQSGAGGGNTKTSATTIESARYLLEQSPKFGDVPPAAADAFTDSSRSRYAGLSSYADQCGGETHVIMVSNKDPNGGDLAAGQSGYQELTGESCVAGWGCIADTAGYLRSQGYTVHAVNFAPDSGLETNMKEVAEAGGGMYRYASNADELAAAITEIMDSIVVSDASMAAPGVAVNQLNRFQYLDEVYYALFRPSLTGYWEGNLKRYRLGDTGIIDEKGRAAVDPKTGFFFETSNSWWGDRNGDPNDGNQVNLGGAREELEFALVPRKLWVSRGTTMGLVEAEDDLSLADLGMPAGTEAEKPDHYDLLVSGWGDPLHAEPRLVNFGFSGTLEEAESDPSKQDNTVFVATNGGAVHAINARSGAEIFTWMPLDEVQKTHERITNTALDAADPRRGRNYGLDGGIRVWREAKTGGGINHVYLYVSQRRGGRNIYALDVTNRDAPKMLWEIKGGVTSGFDALGQTWSQPALARIMIGGAPRMVMVFGGGYSAADHDTPGSISSGDALGNAIYIVDAKTGDLLHRFDSTDNADLKWSIAAPVGVGDVELDGIADVIYVADLGGQIFRIDLNRKLVDGSVQNSLDDTRIVTFAKLGISDPSHSSIRDHRRFYVQPEIALSMQDGKPVIHVVIGSGYRAYPLNQDAEDHIYMIDDRDALGDTSSGVVTLTELADATSEGTVDLDGKSGWYIRLLNGVNREGEKVVANAVVVGGVIYVPTYLPETAYEDRCNRVIGSSRIYGLNIVDGSGALRNNDGTYDRARDVLLPGLAPPLQITEQDGVRRGILGTEVIQLGTSSGGKSYRKRWFEVPDRAKADDILDQAINAAGETQPTP